MQTVVTIFSPFLKLLKQLLLKQWENRPEISLNYYRLLYSQKVLTQALLFRKNRHITHHFVLYIDQTIIHRHKSFSFEVTNTTALCRLLHNHQLGVIQHDFFVPIHIKLYRSYRIVLRTFELYYFAKTKLLMLYPLAFF